MTHPPAPFPDHGERSDSLDVITLDIDGPSDLPVGPVHPAVRKLLDAERGKIQQWQAWLEKQDREPPKDVGG